MEFDDAVAALEGTKVSAEQAAPAESPAQESTQAAPDSASVEEFLPRADLDALLEGVADPTARERIERAYSSFQGGFTKKTQELAEQRKQFEGLDPSAAREAYEFVQALQTDRDFALQVHSELSTALERAGLTPAQAQVEATRQISEAQSSELDPSDPVVQKLNELEQWKENQEREGQRQQAIREIERQADAIRRANTSYTDEDMDVIYKLAASTAGDLFAAEEYFTKVRDRLAQSYVAQKASVPSGVGSGGSSVSSETPVRLTNMEDAHKAATERLNQILAAGE